jgi:hypothetical protein
MLILNDRVTRTRSSRRRGSSRWSWRRRRWWLSCREAIVLQRGPQVRRARGHGGLACVGAPTRTPTSITEACARYWHFPFTHTSPTQTEQPSPPSPQASDWLPTAQT